MGPSLIFILTSMILGANTWALTLVNAVHPTVRYQPKPLEDWSVPTDLIQHFNKILKPQGLSEFDERNLGNIPFYWVDQIYLSSDFKKSITLKMKVELQESTLEEKLLQVGSAYALHSRTANRVPYALYFVGYSQAEALRLSSLVKVRTQSYRASLGPNPEVLQRLASFVLPEASAAESCTVGSPLNSRLSANLQNLKNVAFSKIFDSLKSCLVSAIRGTWNGVKNSVTGVGDLIQIGANTVGGAAQSVFDQSSHLAKRTWNLATGFYKDAQSQGVVAASKNAGQKVIQKAADLQQKMVQSVEGAIAAVTAFPERIKQFFSAVWEKVTTGIKAAAEQFLDYPEALAALLCNFIGNLAGTAMFGAVVTFLTGGTGIGPVLANIGTRVVALGSKLKKLSSVLSTLQRLQKNIAGPLMKKIGAGIERLSEATVNTVEKMSKYKLTKTALETVQCVL